MRALNGVVLACGSYEASQEMCETYAQYPVAYPHGSVYNTGDGIAPEDMPHIFERFYRCDKARTGNGSYGLGLAIAQSAVEAAGGEITVESEYGRWARFRVILRDTEF